MDTTNLSGDLDNHKLLRTFMLIFLFNEKIIYFILFLKMKLHIIYLVCFRRLYVINFIKLRKNISYFRLNFYFRYYGRQECCLTGDVETNWHSCLSALWGN